MQLMRHRPLPPLDRYIDCFWWSQRNEVQRQAEHMLPSGGAQLVFAFHEAPILCTSPDGRSIAWSGSMVHGPQSRYYVAGAKPTGAVLGVAFRPGAASSVLGVPMAELAEQHVGLDALWGLRARDLRDRLLSAAGPVEAFRLLERSLAARLDRPLLMHPAVAQALASPWSSSMTRVADLQRASGYSPKHFIALFRASVGLTPKQYSRIRRFNAVVRSIAAEEGGGLAGLAAAAGYADQAHLTRDFREFAGVTPSAYRRGGPGRPLHHRVADPAGASRG